MTQHMTSLLILILVLQSSCKSPETSKKAPLVATAAEAAKETGTGSDNVPKSAPPVPAQPAVVEAKLAGYPENKTPNPLVEISVTGVAQYKFKTGEAGTNCEGSAGYSPYTAATSPIKIDFSDSSEGIKLIVLCVVGKSAEGVEQKTATQVSWLWSAETPAALDQVDLIEGNNEVKITPKVTTGTWLIVRSRDILDTLPQDGKTYMVNQVLGNGTVLAVGTMAEFIDKTVKNEETWNYTFIFTNSAKRYSMPLRKSMILAKQQLFWVTNASITATQVPTEAKAASKRYICRSKHTDSTTGENRGQQPGSMFSQNNDLKNGLCFYEYGGVVFKSNNYDLLMANKGNPFDLLRWARGLASTTTTSIPNGSIIAGTDDTGAVTGPSLYICLSLNATISGKAGAHMPNGCRSYVGNNNGTPSVNPNFDVLAFK